MNEPSRDESNECRCTSDILTFECTVMNGLATSWNGSAFSCANSQSEIRFFNITATDETCNDGMITGRVIRHQDNNYTSQVNVTASTDLTGKSIECARLSDDGSKSVIFIKTLDIGMWDIHVIFKHY